KCPFGTDEGMGCLPDMNGVGICFVAAVVGGHFERGQVSAWLAVVMKLGQEGVVRRRRHSRECGAIPEVPGVIALTVVGDDDTLEVDRACVAGCFLVRGVNRYGSQHCNIAVVSSRDATRSICKYQLRGEGAEVPVGMGRGLIAR